MTFVALITRFDGHACSASRRNPGRLTCDGGLRDKDAELAVAFVVSAISGVLLLIAARLAYEFHPPDSIPGVLGLFALLVIGFAAFGTFLGAVLPTARAAQAVGMLVWFVMLFLG